MPPPFMISTPDEGKWSVSRHGRFNSRETAQGTHWIEGWLLGRAGMYAVEKRKIAYP
jgi:hypothetical protein